MKRITLKDIKCGGIAVVSAVASEGTIRRRLIDMGVIPGTRVKVVRTAPLGDPVEISLRGSRISIRRSEAGKIYVVPDGEGDECT